MRRSIAISVLLASCATEPVELPEAPRAFAGFDGFAVAGAAVSLDASLSTDPDGDVLSYAWRIAASPEGSRAIIENTSAKVTSLVPDVLGTYVVQLTVSDGVLSARDLVAFTATATRAAAGRPPIALAPSSQNTVLEDPVTIAVSGTNVQAIWLRVPAGVVVDELEWSVTGQEIRFVPAQPGEYWLAAISKNEEASSPPAIATVLVNEDARPRPRAELSAPMSAARNARVLFDGRASEGFGAALSWSFVADPSDGVDTLADVATGCPTGQCRLLVPSKAGTYMVALEIEENGVRGATAVCAVEVE